jgi:NADPH:quinone reductase-like Zn-dependent oxidoreductase
MLAFRVTHHGGPEVLALGEEPDPVPAPGESLVRVRACALNRLDLWVREGVPGHRFPLPIVPGAEIAGILEASAGPAPLGLAPGDPVLVAPGVSCGLCARCLEGDDPLCAQSGILGETRDGGYAERVVVPTRNLLPLPAGLSFAEAAAVPLAFLTAWRMLGPKRGDLRPLESVLVHAAGSGVSSAAIQIARLRGAAVIVATAGSDAKLEKAAQLGATHTVHYKSDGADFVRAAREATGGRGVDVVVDHVGGETFERSLKALAPGGRIVLCGATADAAARINLRAVFFKSLAILGSTMGSLGELRELLRHVERGALRPVLDRTYPWVAARTAQEALAAREQFGKIVLVMDDEDGGVQR